MIVPLSLRCFFLCRYSHITRIMKNILLILFPRQMEMLLQKQVNSPVQVLCQVVTRQFNVDHRLHIFQYITRNTQWVRGCFIKGIDWHWINHIHTWKKCHYTPIWGSKIGMDRIFELPVGWNWHEMYLWVLPNEIQPYLGRTVTSTPSGITEVKYM